MIHFAAQIWRKGEPNIVKFNMTAGLGFRYIYKDDSSKNKMMDWKEFLKPTKKKIGYTLLLFFTFIGFIISIFRLQYHALSYRILLYLIFILIFYLFVSKYENFSELFFKIKKGKIIITVILLLIIGIFGYYLLWGLAGNCGYSYVYSQTIKCKFIIPSINVLTFGGYTGMITSYIGMIKSLIPPIPFGFRIMVIGNPLWYYFIACLLYLKTIKKE